MIINGWKEGHGPSRRDCQGHVWFSRLWWPQSAEEKRLDSKYTMEKLGRAELSTSWKCLSVTTSSPIPPDDLTAILQFQGNLLGVPSSFPGKWHSVHTNLIRYMEEAHPSSLFHCELCEHRWQLCLPSSVASDSIQIQHWREHNLRVVFLNEWLKMSDKTECNTSLPQAVKKKKKEKEKKESTVCLK